MAKKAAAPKKAGEVPAGLFQALAAPKATADLEALLSDTIDVFGGTRQVALYLHQAFMDAPAGGMARQRILESIQRLITTCTAQKVGATRSPSDMTEEELDETA